MELLRKNKNEGQFRIRRDAVVLLRSLFSGAIYDSKNSEDIMLFLREAPKIAAKSLNMNVLYVPEIVSNSNVSVTSGTLNRKQRTIQISTRFAPEVQRFTLAHELAHSRLHNGQEMFRDRPLSYDEPYKMPWNTLEYEADLWAAEFLMPSKQIERCFKERFGTFVDGINDMSSLLYWLRCSFGNRYFDKNRVKSDPSYRSFLLSKAHSNGCQTFQSLSALFSITPSAMAIQLNSLGLVT